MGSPVWVDKKKVGSIVGELHCKIPTINSVFKRVGLFPFCLGCFPKTCIDLPYKVNLYFGSYFKMTYITQKRTMKHLANKRLPSCRKGHVGFNAFEKYAPQIGHIQGEMAW